MNAAIATESDTAAAKYSRLVCCQRRCTHHMRIRRREARLRCLIGHLHCLVGVVGFDLLVTGGTPVVAQAVPLIPPLRTARAGVVLVEPRHDTNSQVPSRIR